MFEGLVLAAGVSNRLGFPKQEIAFGEQTFLQRSVALLMEVGATRVVCVLPPFDVAGMDELPKGVLVGRNEHPEHGMGSSLKLGLAMLKDSESSILVTLVDQPFLDLGHLKNMLEESTCHPSSIVASAYGGGVGVPALFPSIFRDQLRRIPDGSGAKKFIKQHGTKTRLVENPSLAFDIDTPEDFQRYLACQSAGRLRP